MPTFTSLKKLNRNLIYSLYFIFYFWPASYKVRTEILEYIDNNKIEIIHSNLISFFILIYWIKKKRPKIRVTLHSRTLPYNNLFSKLQARISLKLFDGIIFITENEKAYFEKLIKININGTVIYNPVELNNKKKKVKFFDKNKRLKVLALSNYSYQRGTDRIIEIARHLKNIKINDITFYIAGDTKFPRIMPGKFMFLGLMGGSLEDLAFKEKVNDRVKFIGYRQDAEEVINSIDVLIKPTREFNPWGRDVLESLASGKPVISIGKYDKFVKNDFTGLLLSQFSVSQITNWLINYKDNKYIHINYEKNALEIIKKYCNPKKNSAAMESFFINCL